MKRLLSILLAAVMLLGVMPWQVFAEGEDKPILTVKFNIVTEHSIPGEEKYTEKIVKFYNENDVLKMQGTLPNTTYGQLRGRSFMGWATAKKSEFSKSSSNRIFSANNTVGDILEAEKDIKVEVDGEDKTVRETKKFVKDSTITLYAYYDGYIIGDTKIFGKTVPKFNKNVGLHNYVFIYDELRDNEDKYKVLNKGVDEKLKEAKNILFNGDIVIKSIEDANDPSKGGTPRYNNPSEIYKDPKEPSNLDTSQYAKGDKGSVFDDWIITSYYHPTIEGTKINFTSSFNMHKGIALLIRQNGSFTLSNSEVKLELKLPEGIELEDNISQAEFDSYTFRAKDVEAKSKEGSKVNATVENNNLTLEKNTFDVSFEEGKGKLVRNLTLIAEPKKRGEGETQNPTKNQVEINNQIDSLKATEVVKEMHWNGDSAAHFNKIKAKELADNDTMITLEGSVGGKVLVQLNGRNYPMSLTPILSNKINFKFAYPEVTFVKNTKALGDSAEQELAKIKAKQEDDKGTKLFIGDKDFPKDPTFNKDGKEVKFLGWNTKPDGTGDTFTSETDVKEDTKIYAIWEAKEEPQPNPNPQPDPQGPFYKGSILILPEEKEKEADREDHMAYIFGYPDKSVKPEGTLTRAEAAAMVVRLGNLDLSDTTKADYPDLKDGAWYLPHINAALRAGMLDTDDAGMLRPDSPVTRGEFGKMIAAIDKASDGKAPFTDIAGHKYEKEINQVYGNGRALGYEDGSFKPDASLTRAEAAAFLNRVFNRVADDAAVSGLEDRLEKFTDLQKGTWYYYELVEATNSHELIRRGGQDELNRAYEKWIAILEKRAAR